MINYWHSTCRKPYIKEDAKVIEREREREKIDTYLQNVQLCQRLSQWRRTETHLRYMRQANDIKKALPGKQPNVDFFHSVFMHYTS